MDIWRIIKSVLVVSAIAIVVFSPLPNIIFQQLFNFFFFGLIPFTATTLPLELCLLLYGIGLFSIIHWFRRQPIFAANPVDREFIAKQHARRAVMLKLKQTSYQEHPYFARRKSALRKLFAFRSF